MSIRVDQSIIILKPVKYNVFFVWVMSRGFDQPRTHNPQTNQLTHGLAMNGKRADHASLETVLATQSSRNSKPNQTLISITHHIISVVRITF